MGYSVTTEEDLTAATITGGTIHEGSYAITNYYLDKAVTELEINFTATSNISANADIIEFSGKNLLWKPNQILTGIKSDGSLFALFPYIFNGCLDKIKTPQAINSGEVIWIYATCVDTSEYRWLFDFD